ncbi:MAG: hypothetical protein JWM96_1352 [Alphaproteobacteria bacterium]|nr:hypothetical protein [Alphaproteobacteria bacterium]
MPRRMTPAQAHAALRRAQSEQRRAVAKYNSQVRQFNRRLSSAVDEYNREARGYNARQRTAEQRRRREIEQLRRQPAVTYTITQRSTVNLDAAYQLVESDFETGALPDDMACLVDLAEAEVANSAQLANGAGSSETTTDGTADSAAVTAALAELSDDLHRRWNGALFALNPDNPEAARHFCTSARETILALIELRAPDEVVLSADPDCATHQGRPARRAKLTYLLSRYGRTNDNLNTFVESDVDDVMTLVHEVNNGTHGSAGRYDHPTLMAIKRRVEGAVQFLTTIVQAA